MKQNICFLILLFSMYSLSKAQNVYYVSPAGNDLNAGTSLANPFQTIGKAALVVQPGDMVYIRSGTYFEYVIMGKSGTATSYITFQAYPGENPVVDGSKKQTNIPNPWNRPDRLISVEGNYIKLKGLEVMNSASFGVFVNANYAVLENLHVHNCYLTGIYFYNCNYGKVSQCKLHDFYDYGTGGAGGGGNADGLGSTSGNDIPPPVIYGYHTFSNNLVYNCSDDGIDTWTSQFNVIENNIVHHAGYTNASNGGFPIVSGLPVGDGNGFKLGRGGNNTVRNNVSYANLVSGFVDNDGIGNVLYNNTAYQTIGRCFSFFTTGGNTLKNNLSYGGAPNLMSGLPLEDHNSWNLAVSDPLFISTDPLSKDFLHLSANSGAIDAGIDVGIPYSGNAPDLGAYESAFIKSVTPPVIGLVTQPTCTTATGSVVLSGLPSTGTWILTRTPGGVTYSGTGISTTISGLLSGTYTFNVTNDGGIKSAVSNNLVINAQPIRPSSPTGQTAQTFCSGNSPTIASLAVTGTGIKWYATATGGTALSSTTALANGRHYYASQTNGACESTTRLNVTATVVTSPSPPSIGAITQPTRSLSTGSVVLNNLPTTGTWIITRTPGGITTSGKGKSKTITVLPAGSYTFAVKNSSGCSSVQSANVLINAQPAAISLKAANDSTLSLLDFDGNNSLNGIQPNGTTSISVYPNPASISFALKINDLSEKRVMVRIFSQTGRKFREFGAENIHDKVLESIPVNNLSDGIYIVQVLLNGTDMYSAKIVVLK